MQRGATQNAATPSGAAAFQNDQPTNVGVIGKGGLPVGLRVHRRFFCAANIAVILAAIHTLKRAFRADVRSVFGQDFVHLGHLPDTNSQRDREG